MKIITLISLCCLLFVQPGLSHNQLAEKPADEEGPWIVLAHYQDKADVLALRPFYDLWKIDEKNQTVLMQVNHKADYQELLTRGFKVEPHKELMAQQRHLKAQKSRGVKTITNFPCYRTVQETFAAMSSMESNYPDLVTLVDIGDSWHKQQPGGDPGFDMQVVKITNQNVVDPNKPILYAMGSIHSREYPPAELVTRFAEHLLSNYGVDADVTWLVDHHEIHLLLQGNPDGRVISEGETSAFQRKNYNANHCAGGGGFFDMQGVDMNRNFEYLWNQGTGSSGDECRSNYRGLQAVSEPETAAINNYIQTLFPDQRGPGINDMAPLEKPGVYLDIHNVAELTLFPWGYADGAGQAPNHNQLQTLARRMSFYTGYRAEQSNASLGGADGASDDNAYGLLGVAAYTIELGESGFYSTCNAFDNTIWPDNLPAMIYAAKAARMPYTIASGPDVIDLPTTPLQVTIGQDIAVSGTATDLQFSTNNGIEATQNITGVKAYLQVPPWNNGAVATDMAAADGNFNSKSEGFSGTVATTGLAAGRYTLWFEATDAAGFTGVPSAVFVDVVNPGNLGTVTGVVRDSESNQAVPQARVTYDGQMTTTDGNGSYSIVTSATSSDLVVTKQDYVPQTINNVIITGGQTTTQDVLLLPTCDQTVFGVDVEAYSDINQALADSWSLSTASGSNDWRVVSGDDHTITTGRAFVATNVATVSDKSLVSPPMQIPMGLVQLSFWHKHQFESGNEDYDGGVIEISSNGGSSWTDLGNRITNNGYNGTLSGDFSNPLGGRSAFTDTLGTFTEVTVDLSSFAGQTVMIRWRMGTDNTTSAGDWVVDDIRLGDFTACDVIFVDDFEA